MSPLDYETRALEAVSDFLGSALPDSGVKRRVAIGEDRQLLLLTMPQLVAGFGFTSQDLNSTYDELYGAFKKEYAENRNKWDELDLAFVLCVPEGISGLQAFGSSIETDVYFCRKYVVPMDGQVGAALARLPFLPLFSERGVAVRPPSAQTFLQESGVPSVMAKYLVRKGERSARSVVVDCVEGTFGELELPQQPPDGSARMMVGADTPIRVRSINIDGFRAYRERAQLSFGEDLTILFGPNGFGKTSVFDAIDFAFTGEIGRLRTKSEGRFRQVAAHLDSDNSENGVALTVEIGDETHQLIRRVADRKSAELDGIRLDRKSVLERLTGWQGPGTDRIENIVSLFRATHLFSQEHQELAREFRRDCRLSSEVVARLLAYEDYQATRTKVTDICDIATKEMRDLEFEIEELTIQTENESNELESLGRVLHEEQPNENLAALVETIAKRILAIGVEVASMEPEVETVRSWRAALEAKLSELQRAEEALNESIGLLEELPSRRKELARTKEHLEKVLSRLALAKTRISEAKDKLTSRAAEIERLEGKLKYLVGRRSNLAWIEENQKLHNALQTEVATTSERLTLKTHEHDRLSDMEKALSERLRQTEQRKALAARELEHRQRDLGRGQVIHEGIDSWQVKRTRLEEINRGEERLKGTDSEIGHAKEQLLAAEHSGVRDEKRLTQQIDKLEASLGELHHLIGAIGNHIKDSVCPTCGQDHGSQQELLDRIAAQLGQEAAAVERASRDKIRSRLERIRSEIEELGQRQELVAAQLAELAGERDLLTAENQAFQSLLEEFELDVTRDPNAVRQAVTTRCAILEEQVGELSAQVTRATKELIDEGREWELTTATSKRAHGDVRGLNSKLESARRRLARLLEHPINQGDVTLGTDRETVLEHQKSTGLEIAATQNSLAGERESRRSEQESLEEAEAELRTGEREASALVTEVARLEGRRQGIESVLADRGIEPGESKEGVLGRAREISIDASAISGLIEDVAAAELIIDAATTRAAYRRLQSRLTARRSAMSKLGSKRDAYGRWLKYFGKVLALVASEQDEAVSRFTREYGPRTSVIQRRLRSVYGFDDIEIRNQDSDILVRVLRGGKQFRPTDYFSQSQQQTLLLGLFLSACVSQTWSGLAPVFLDDPVTHFDDLNIFAFLDLVDGMLNDYGTGKRQFVISTCDFKFYELAREKFAHRGESVKYYSFEGIGEQGPIIRGS